MCDYFFRKFSSYTVAIVLFIAGFLSIKNASALAFLAPDAREDVKKMIRFLTEDVDVTTSNLPTPGLTYKGTAGELNGKKLPLSFFCTNEYWQQYVLQLPGEEASSVDLYNPDNQTFTPMPGSRGQRQVERINILSGCNIYDAATWQIALALAADDGFKGDEEENLFSLAENQTLLLKVGHDGNDSGDPNQQVAPKLDANRRVTVCGNEMKFLYNGCEVNRCQEAYFFRQVPKTFNNDDPLASHVEVKVEVKDARGNTLKDDQGNAIVQDLPDSEIYPKICISWTDWKPITGENIWAFLIGPLHAALIQYKKNPCVPFQSIAVQNAIAILGTFQKMQSQTGCIYYAPADTLANIGDQKVSPYEVSVENNISALGGLLVFRRVLQDELHYGYFSSFFDKNEVKKTLKMIHTMLYGGNYVVVSHKDEYQTRMTRGLLSFLKNEAWNHDANEFYSGGEANKRDENTNQETAHWIPYRTKAVDVNTWGLAVLGQPFIDSIKNKNGQDSFGNAYRLWENVKKWGGYYGADGELWGVGYSDHDGNGTIHHDDKTGILSGEWTSGAITALRSLITQYKEVLNAGKESQKHLKNAKYYLADLQKDHDAMVRHIRSLRTDKYADELAFHGVRPSNYKELISIPTDKLGYLYANKRYLIPFGWYANPIPSMASTTWAVMLYYNFNPFSPKGDYSANDLDDLQGI